MPINQSKNIQKQLLNVLQLDHCFIKLYRAQLRIKLLKVSIYVTWYSLYAFSFSFFLVGTQ